MAEAGVALPEPECYCTCHRNEGKGRQITYCANCLPYGWPWHEVVTAVNDLEPSDG